MSASNGKSRSTANSLHCSNSCLSDYQKYSYFAAVSTRHAGRCNPSLNIAIHSVRYQFSTREIWEFKFISENVTFWVSDGHAAFIFMVPGWLPWRIVKRLAGEKGWIICYLGCLISDSQLLLARCKTISFCPFGGSD
jgi:hypothetical protein